MKKLMAIAAVLVTAGSLIYMMFANPHVPILDANRQVLAETELQGYCAGRTYFSSQGRGDLAYAKECWDEYADNKSSAIQHEVVQEAFCKGLVAAGLPITTSECMNVLVTYQYWPTMSGRLTGSWNRAFPYPLEQSSADLQYGDSSRTGDRENNDREGTLTRP